MKEYKIGLHHHIMQAEGNIVSDMDGEKVMLSIENGKYYNLGVIGGAIWDLIQQPISLKELVGKLQVQYDVSEEQCTMDVQNFLEELNKEQLIIIK